MSTTVVVLLCILAVLIIAAVAWWFITWRRRQQLQDRFGPEYDRVVSNRDSKREAERELTARAERHDQMDIRPLTQASRERFQAEWRTAQARFVDEPSVALAKADVLVQEAMTERGYPVGDFSQRTADLSVEHADVLDHYRAAHRIANASENGDATTEDMRQAMVHYRALFGALLDDSSSNHSSNDDARRPV